VELFGRQLLAPFGVGLDHFGGESLEDVIERLGNLKDRSSLGDRAANT
jgi:hypothetical protein